MIGAIYLRLNETSRAKLYPSGSHSHIDWDTEYPSALGSNYTICKFKAGFETPSIISIAEGFDGNFILRLVETKRYIVKFDKQDAIDLPNFQNEGNRFFKCERDEDSVTFQFINYLGKSKITFPGTGITFPFEVVPDKMNYEDDYIKLTEALADVCSELLLDYAGSTSNVYSQSENNTKTLLEQFIFLRKFCYAANLQSLFEAIKRNPDRILGYEDYLKPIGSGIPSKKFYTNPFSHSRGWMNICHANTSHNYYMPQMVAVTHKYDKLDTPANRFVKFALHKFQAICSDLIEALHSDSNGMQSECMLEAKSILASLDSIFRDSFFDDIGNLDIMPQNNQVLIQREGYSNIFSAYSMLDLALQLDWKGKDDIYEGESKNVALLYEYWLFFELYRIIESIKGCKPVEADRNPFILTDDGRLTISLKAGKESCQSFVNTKYGVKINLYYNREFSRKDFQTTRYEGSYSRKFRPDYSLAIFPSEFKGDKNGEESAIISGAVSYIHFDAKYRITDLTSLIGNNDDADEDEALNDKTDSIVCTYKRGDLLKMHTYNDAIRRTVGSYVLYPGMYDKSGAGNKTFSIYDEILPGVGAFSIKPSIRVHGEMELCLFIESLLESEVSNKLRLNRLKYYTETILSEPSAHMPNSKRLSELPIKNDDTFVMGYIRGNSPRSYYHFLKKNGFLENGKEFLFYFYAIKGKNVYSHHKDIFRANYFRFYVNRINRTNSYILEPILCRIVSNELISKTELVDKLLDMGFDTSENAHHADFYYVLTVKVADSQYAQDEYIFSDVNNQNGNDTFSPLSPKVLHFRF